MHSNKATHKRCLATIYIQYAMPVAYCARQNATGMAFWPKYIRVRQTKGILSARNAQQGAHTLPTGRTEARWHFARTKCRLFAAPWYI